MVKSFEKAFKKFKKIKKPLDKCQKMWYNVKVRCWTVGSGRAEDGTLKSGIANKKNFKKFLKKSKKPLDKIFWMWYNK